MPEIGAQLEALADLKLARFAARLLLKPGTQYAQAVEAFSPYNELKQVHADIRSQAASLIKRAVSLGIPAYVFVNNRFEGCAPLTIAAILDELQ